MSDCNCYKIEGNSGDNTVTCMYMYDIYIYMHKILRIQKYSN